MKAYKRLNGKEIFISVLLFFFSFFSLKLLLPENTSYDYYSRLAKTFLQGDVCLQENPEWLNELIPIATKGFCVVYPITPALLSVPFVYAVQAIAQTDISRVVFGFTAVLLYFFFKSRHYSRSEAVFFSCVWNFSTIYFSMSAVGSAWYFAQTVGSFFLFASLFVFQKKIPLYLFLSGLFLGLSANARLPLHLYVFFFIGSLWIIRLNFKRFIIATLFFGLGFVPVFVVQRVYNYERYHTFSDAGYYLIPGKFSEEDFKDGEFNLKNIPKHLKILFFQSPKRIDQFPYVVPSYWGLSILFTSPFLVIGFLWLIRKKKFLELCTVIGVLLLEMSHGTVGFTQFGYRFGLDVYPLVFLESVQLMKENKNATLRNILLSLILVGAIVNLWGVLAFRNSWFVW